MVKGSLSRAGIEYTAISIEGEPNKAAAEGIRGIPTTIVYDGDTEVTRFVGVSDDLIGKLKKVGVKSV
jgi:hypothetical protein